MILHVRRESSGGVVPPIANHTLVRLLMIMSLEMDFEVIASGESGLTVWATVLLITGMQLDMSVTTPLVLEETLAEIARERHLVAVTL